MFKLPKPPEGHYWKVRLGGLTNKSFFIVDLKKKWRLGMIVVAQEYASPNADSIVNAAHKCLQMFEDRQNALSIRKAMKRTYE